MPPLQKKSIPCDFLLFASVFFLVFAVFSSFRFIRFGCGVACIFVNCAPRWPSSIARFAYSTHIGDDRCATLQLEYSNLSHKFTELTGISVWERGKGRRGEENSWKISFIDLNWRCVYYSIDGFVIFRHRFCFRYISFGFRSIGLDLSVPFVLLLFVYKCPEASSKC